MNDWRPIASAPKDGTRVLLWGNGPIRFGYMDELGNWRELTHGPMKTTPTHWRPIPTPPQTKADA